MERRELTRGQIMQLDPELCRNPMFAGCFLTVTEPKSFGAQGYVQCPGSNGKPGGQAYYRATWEEMELTGGRAAFVIGYDDEGEPTQPAKG